MGDSNGFEPSAHKILDSAEHSHQHYAQRGRAEAGGRRGVEVITGPDRRRRWPRELKAQIIAESFAPGANVSQVARLHGVGLGLLHYWRRCARNDAGDSPIHFVPIVTKVETGSGNAWSRSGSSIEIEVPGAVIRVNGPVDTLALQAVMAAVRGNA
jgi:transposase